MNEAAPPLHEAASGGLAGRAGVFALVTAVVAVVIAVAALGIAWFEISTRPTASNAALAGGAALLAGTAAALVALLRAGARIASDRLLALIAILVATTAVASFGGAAIPLDLSLFSLGRPPLLRIPLAACSAVLAIAPIVLLARGAPARTIALPLVFTALALEGLLLATPPWLMLALAVIAFLAGPPTERRTALGLRIAFVAVPTAFALAAFFGADAGTSLDPVLRVTALAIAATVLLGEGSRGARCGAATLLVAIGAVGWIAIASKLLLRDATAGLHVDVLGSELSLFNRHPNLIAPWFGGGVLIAGSLAFGKGASGPFRVLARLVLPLAAASLLLTASRLAIVATAVAALIPALSGLARSPSLRRAARAAAIAGVFVAILGIGALAVKPLAAKFAAFTDATQSFNHRSFRIRVGLATALASPILGQGPLCYFRQGEFTPESNFEGESSADHPHSLVIALFQGVGGVGLLAVLALLVATARAALAALRDGDEQRVDGTDWGNTERAIAWGVSLALIAQLATNLIDLGDALDTLLPSRWLLDAGMLGALAATGAAAGAAATTATPAARGGGRGIPLLLAAACGAAALLVGLGRAETARGRQFLAEGRTARAQEEFASAVTRLPIDADAWLDLATSTLQIGKRAQARDALDHALALAPSRPDLHEALARFSISIAGGENAARLAAARARELDPRGATPRRLGLLSAQLEFDAGNRDAGFAALAAALRADVRALASARDPDDSTRLRLGKHSLEWSDVLAALRDTDSAASQTAVSRRAELRICELALQAGDLAASREALARFREYSPNADPSDMFESRLLRREGRLDEALAAADRAVKKFDDPLIAADRAEILFDLGRTADSLAALEAALAVSRDVYFFAYSYHHVLSRLAEAYARENDRVAEARTREQIAFFTQDPADRARQWIAVAALVDPEPALEHLREALTLVMQCPANPEIRALARDVGDRLGRLGASRPDPSAYADSLERAALALNGGVVAHEFRHALLGALGLDRRAQQAAKDIR